MRKRGTKSDLQRTVVLTCDSIGDEIGRRVTRMLGEWDSPPVVTVMRAVRGDFPDAEAVTRMERALLDVSRLTHRTRLRSMGYGAERLGDLVVWLVGGAQAPFASLAELVHERARVLLGVEPLTLGLVISGVSNADEGLAGTGPDRGVSRSAAGLEGGGPVSKMADAAPLVGAPGCERSHGSGRPPGGGDGAAAPPNGADKGRGAPAPQSVSGSKWVQVASLTPRPGACRPAPDGTAFAQIDLCYVATLVNEDGLTLGEAPALYERVSRFLALHICTPLRDAPSWVEQSRGWEDDAGFGTFGLTWVAWPRRVAEAWAARRLAQAVHSQLVGSHQTSPDVEAWLREAKLDPTQLIQRLTPGEVHETVGASRRQAPPSGIGLLFKSPRAEIHPLLASLDAAVDSWTSTLTACDPAWEQVVQREIRGVIVLTRSWIEDALDSGGFQHARNAVTGLDRRLGEWAVGVEERALKLRSELAEVDGTIQEARDELAAHLDKLPQRRICDLLRLLRRPAHWLQLFVRCRESYEFALRYLSLRAARLEMEVAIAQMERSCGVYWAAGSELQTVSRELDELERALADRLGVGKTSAVAWPDLALLLGDEPQRLLADLEQQCLPGEEVAASSFLDAFGALSGLWSELPAEEAVASWLKGQAAAFTDLSVRDVIRCRYPDARDRQKWLEAVRAQAVPLCRWDAAAVSDQERVGVGTLTVLLGENEEWLREEDLPWMFVPLERRDGLAVVTIRWGIPAMPAPGWQETETGVDDR